MKTPSPVTRRKDLVLLSPLNEVEGGPEEGSPEEVGIANLVTQLLLDDQRRITIASMGITEGDDPPGVDEGAGEAEEVGGEEVPVAAQGEGTRNDWVNLDVTRFPSSFSCNFHDFPPPPLGFLLSS